MSAVNAMLVARSRRETDMSNPPRRYRSTGNLGRRWTRRIARARSATREDIRRRREDERCLERRDADGDRRELPLPDLRERARGELRRAERVLDDGHLGHLPGRRDGDREDDLAAQRGI